MAARGYEFYLRVLRLSLTRSLRSLVRDTFSMRCSVYYIDIAEMYFQHEIFCLLYRYC